MPLVGIGTLPRVPTPFSPASVPLPPETGGRGHTSLRVGGWGESQFRRGAYTTLQYGTLYMYILCDIFSQISAGINSRHSTITNFYTHHIRAAAAIRNFGLFGKRWGILQLRVNNTLYIEPIFFSGKRLDLKSTQRSSSFRPFLGQFSASFLFRLPHFHAAAFWGIWPNFWPGRNIW